jgi:hypothetical protein
MSGIAGISGSSWSAILGGARSQLQAHVFARAVEEAGLLDDHLAAGFDALGRQSQSLSEAGLASARSDLLGSFIDALA